jgi:hypothetical protein
VEDIREKTTNDYTIVLNVPSRKIAYQCKLTGEVEVISYNEEKYRISATMKKKGKKTLPFSRYERNPDNKKKTYTRYNEDGRMKYVIIYDWKDQQHIARTFNIYEYLSIDEYGNWTQRLLQSYDMLDGKKKKFEKFSTRKIEYYETGEGNESI